ncbi:MAG: DNA replication/repair protein RecF [Rickettsiales bacterium]
MDVTIDKLIINNFRNFSQKKLEFNSQQVIFCGNNGVGKTNSLEAISLMGRNKSLREDDFDEMINIESSKTNPEFTIFAELGNHDYINNIAVKYNLFTKKKILECNGEAVGSKRQNDLKNYLINFIALTPQIEQLFIQGKSQRRDYLDKIVCDIDISHQTRINNYQKLLKERLLILQKYKNQTGANKWLDIVENNIAESGIAIAFARIEAVEFFNKAINSFTSNFPKTILVIKGEIEDKIIGSSALNLENFYKEKLKNNRQSDLENFKTEFGVHRADFDAIFVAKNLSALKSSTGEQKAIMLSISLARAKISRNYKNQPTILLFDEVVSHMDLSRKTALFNEIHEVNLQSFFTATSFDLIPNDLQHKFQIINFSI